MAEKSRIVLYIKENAKALTNPNIAVVGTRHPSEWSQKVEERLVNDCLEQNQDFFTLLLQNDEIKKEVLGLFVEDTYQSLRAVNA